MTTESMTTKHFDGHTEISCATWYLWNMLFYFQPAIYACLYCFFFSFWRLISALQANKYTNTYTTPQLIHPCEWWKNIHIFFSFLFYLIKYNNSHSCTHTQRDRQTHSEEKRTPNDWVRIPPHNIQCVYIQITWNDLKYCEKNIEKWMNLYFYIAAVSKYGYEWLAHQLERVRVGKKMKILCI